jgi:hypothetical protein
MKIQDNFVSFQVVADTKCDSYKEVLDLGIGVALNLVENDNNRS